MPADRYVHVAAVQMLPATGEPAANVARATRLARQSVEEHGAELVVFPECTLTGYTPPPKTDEERAAQRKLAEPVPGPSVMHFARLAKDLHTYIVWGLHERGGESYHNTAVLLSPGGEIVGKYRKVHINKYESPMGWTNGDRFHVWPCVVDGVEFHLGMMICFDREVPEAARCLAVLGADVIAVPQATSCTCDIPIHRDQLRVRAYENEVCIAMANWGGPKFKGHGMLIDPQGVAVEIGGKDEAILSTAFDLGALRELRRRGIYGRHHRQPKAYGPLVRPS